MAMNAVGCVAWWKCNDNLATAAVVDETGVNGGTLTDVGGTATSAAHSVAGVMNTGLVFDGVDDLVNCGSDTSIDSIFDGGGTVSWWQNIAGQGEDNVGRALGKAYWKSNMITDTSTMVFSVLWDGDDGLWTFPVTANVWQHIAITYDADLTTNDPTVYVNGVLTAEAETGTPTIGGGSGRTSDAGSDFVIGARADDDKVFDGIIQDVKLFNRALSADEVAALYNSGSGLVSLEELDYTNIEGLTRTLRRR